MLVVQDDRLGGDLLDVGGRQFLDVHQKRAVTVDVDDLLVGTGDLRAESGGEAVAHRAEAGAGDELAGEFVFVPLARPHLVLADAGGDDGIALRQVVEHLDDGLRQDDLVFLALHVVLHVVAVGYLLGDGVLERSLLFPLGDLFVPGGIPFRNGAPGDHLVQAREGVLDIAEDRLAWRVCFC